MFNLLRLSPSIILFLLLPLVLLLVPDPLQRLYQLVTLKMPDEHQHQHQDGHGHGHGHNHGDDADLTERNRKVWDKMATSYDKEQWQKDLLNNIHSFVLENIQWIGVNFIDPSSSFENNSKTEKTVRVLDYACGPGTITNILYSHANEFVGVDLAQGMVDEYNRRFSHTLPGEVAQTNAKAVVGNFLTSTENGVPEAERGTFDLVTVGLGYHHFFDPKTATERLAAYLKPGGTFMIIDLLTHSKESTDHPNPANHTVAHHGFGEKEVNELFSAAGLNDIRFKVMEEGFEMPGTSARRVFMARAVKH